MLLDFFDKFSGLNIYFLFCFAAQFPWSVGGKCKKSKKIIKTKTDNDKTKEKERDETEGTNRKYQVPQFLPQIPANEKKNSKIARL